MFKIDIGGIIVIVCLVVASVGGLYNFIKYTDDKYNKKCYTTEAAMCYHKYQHQGHDYYKCIDKSFASCSK